MGKNSLTVSLFTYYSLKIKFVSFLKSYPATILFKRKTIKWATKSPINLIKKEKKEKRERERKIEIRFANKKSKFCLLALA